MKSVKFSYLRICDGVRTWKANVSWMESLKFEIEVSSASLYVEKKKCYSVVGWERGQEGVRPCRRENVIDAQWQKRDFSV